MTAPCLRHEGGKTVAFMFRAPWSDGGPSWRIGAPFPGCRYSWVVRRVRRRPAAARLDRVPAVTAALLILLVAQRSGRAPNITTRPDPAGVRAPVVAGPFLLDLTEIDDVRESYAEVVYLALGADAGTKAPRHERARRGVCVVELRYALLRRRR